MGRTRLSCVSRTPWANQTDTGPYGNLGLDVKGIEIYLPITPDLTLGFWCPSLTEFLHEGLTRAQALERKFSPVALLGVGAAQANAIKGRDKARTTVAKLEADLGQIAAGLPLQNSADNVKYVNALEVAQAERYVASSSGDFALVREMIADNANFRRGARFEIS